MSYETVTMQLQPGDSVLFCTDGITDAFDRDGEQFGIARLQELCEAPRLGSPTELLGRIFAAVEHFSHGREQHDDMAAALFPVCDLVISGPPGPQDHVKSTQSLA